MLVTYVSSDVPDLVPGSTEPGVPDMISQEYASSLSREKPYKCRVLRETDELAAIHDEWKALSLESGNSSFFQSREWCEVILQHNLQNHNHKPYVLEARDDGMLVALLPLAIVKKRFRKILTGLAEPYQQYTEMVVREGVDPKAVLQQWLPLIRKSGCDILHLGQVRADSNLYQASIDIVPASGEMDAAPYVPISQWPDYETYFQTLKSKTRKNMRNAINKLEKEAPVQHEVYTDGPEFKEIVERTFAMRKQWLKEMGLTSRAFNDSDFIRLIDKLSSYKTSDKEELKLLGMSLKHGDRPIAEQWGFVFNGCYYAFLSGWDVEYENTSPGKLHLGEVIRTCYDLELDRVDFMIPNIAYKQTWARGEAEVQDQVLALTAKGWLYDRLWLNRLRPVAKSLVYKMPVNVRKKLFYILLGHKED